MVTPEAVQEVLRTIDDPEMPVSIVDLGIVDSVEVTKDSDQRGPTAARISIAILPTFVGCPALPVIEELIREKVGRLPEVSAVDVHFRFDPPWTVDRISPAGRQRLKEVGITVPESLHRKGNATLEPACPFCGSRQVRRENAFGPTRCRMIYYCENCRNPFEHLKRVALPVLRP
jgi:ring-1,2-phenylacetyl-CoA epoxidase subunit PaaD